MLQHSVQLLLGDTLSMHALPLIKVHAIFADWRANH
jgi:hypothetical protein